MNVNMGMSTDITANGMLFKGDACAIVTVNKLRLGGKVLKKTQKISKIL